MDELVIRIPWHVWAPVAGALIVIFIIFALLKKIRYSQQRHNTPEAFDVNIPSMGLIRGDSLLHRWDPRIKIFSGILFSFLSVSLSSFTLILTSMLWASLFCALAKLPGSSIRRRLKPIGILTLALVVFLPLTAPIKASTRLIVFEPFIGLNLNYDALIGAITIGIKATTVVLTTAIMLETSPYTATIMALNKIGFPASIAQMLLLTYRYIFVLVDEAERMHRAMRLRGFEAKTGLETLRIVGSFIGTLFVRSFERIQRITEAMELRGYRGRFPGFYPFVATTKDWVIGILWIALPLGLYVIERFYLIH
ncbi:MAG: cobalt ECF transporter T component CbiQ [Thermodesulforhabdaceae bacterium]